jgi:hypothetical protein
MRLTAIGVSDAIWLKSDLRGASLADVRVARAGFDVTVDETTAFTGMRGSMLSTLTFVEDGVEREISGVELRGFLAERGADVEILRPAPLGPPIPQYYPRGDRS